MSGNLEQYRVFYYVGKLESITLAAEKLYISQPAVSQSIRQLEETLGCKLFFRTSRGVRLTGEGEMLYGHVESGLEAIWNGERILEGIKNLDTGEIRIGASDMTLQFYLLPYLEQFHKMYPGIKIRVSNGPTPETLRQLSQGKIDFGIVSTPVDTTSGMQTIAVKSIIYAFVAGTRFLPYKDQLLGYDILKELPCICLEGDTSTRRFLDEFLADRQIVVAPEFQLATSDMIVQFAIRNLGIGCVMRAFAEKELENGTLFELNFSEPMPPRQICIVTDQKNPMSHAGNRLLQLLTKDINIDYNAHK